MRVVFACVVLLWTSQLLAQDPLGANPPPMQAPAGDASKTWCDIYFAGNVGKDALVFDQNGNYMPDVREVYLWVQIGKQPLVASLASWRGVYRPSTVEKKVWNVRNVKIIDPAEFQKMIDKPVVTTPR